MKQRSEPPKAPEVLRDEIVGLGSRSLRKNYFGKLQQRVADLARFRALLDVAGEAIIVARLPELEVVDANRTALAALGAVGKKAEGQPLSSFFSPPAWRRLEPLFRRSAAPGAGTQRLIVRVGGHGGRELEVASRADSFGRSRYLLLVARDVTERRRAARALITAKEEAERAARMKTEFLSIASHELRTPLTSLRLRLEQVVRSDRTGARIAERLLGPVHRLVVIVDDLLEVSRLDRGIFRLKLGRVDVRAVVEDVVDDLRGRVGSHRVHLAAGTPVSTLADPDRVGQVVANLLENALKFSPPESRIEVRVWSDPGSVCVAVADHGPGIAVVERERLFTPFSRLAGSRTIPGLGLGLFVSRQIARMHGGDVVVGDTAGGGATFTLRIPFGAEPKSWGPSDGTPASEPR
jgi:PAS domain S-box-containing protein